MDDLVKRLWIAETAAIEASFPMRADLLRQAAARITSDAARLKRMEEALEWIGDHETTDEGDVDECAAEHGLDRDEFLEMAHDNLVRRARAALTQSTTDADRVALSDLLEDADYE